MTRKPTIRTLQRRQAAFLACCELEELARLLHLRPERLLVTAENPTYREFTIPKKDGSRRYIEAPVPALKRAQDRLADFLQAVYFFHRTPAAYGFLVRPVDDPQPRHVLSNARYHLGRPWLLNLDMEDFFHSIHTERIQTLFRAPLLNFPDDLSDLLAKLTTYKGRLPMGAPSSPILSNLATIPLDQDLLAYAEEQGWRYTRYADDMTFSGPSPIGPAQIQGIARIVHMWGFRLHPEKQKLYGPDDRNKSVTGLIVSGKQVTLPEDYLPNLESAIYHLSKVIDAQHLTPSGRGHTTRWVEELRQGIFGKLEFARRILGDDHFWVSRLRGAYYDAVRPPEEYDSVSWLEFGYHWDLNANW